MRTSLLKLLKTTCSGCILSKHQQKSQRTLITFNRTRKNDFPRTKVEMHNKQRNKYVYLILRRYGNTYESGKAKQLISSPEWKCKTQILQYSTVHYSTAWRWLVGLENKKKASKPATMSLLAIMELWNSFQYSLYEIASLSVSCAAVVAGVWGVNIKRPVHWNIKRRMPFFLNLTHGFSCLFCFNFF